jgi:hypothetical protein
MRIRRIGTSAGDKQCLKEMMESNFVHKSRGKRENLVNSEFSVNSKLELSRNHVESRHCHQGGSSNLKYHHQLRRVMVGQKPPEERNLGIRKW